MRSEWPLTRYPECPRCALPMELIAVRCGSCARAYQGFKDNEPMRIEFQFLQFHQSYLSGDRVTIALIHNDGENFRMDFDMCLFSERGPNHRLHKPDYQRVVREYYAQALEVAAKTLLPSYERGRGLSELMPVPVGVGARLSWTPVKVGHTRDPEGHFARLVRECVQWRGGPGPYAHYGTR